MDQDVKDILVDGDSTPAVDVNAMIAKATAHLKEELAREKSEKARVTRIAEERGQQAHKAQADLQGVLGYTAKAEHSAIANALAAADAEANAMQADLAAAIETADGKRAAELQRKIGQIEARRHTLEQGKDRIEEEMERAKANPPPKPTQTEIPPADAYEAMIAPLPDNQKQWLRKYKDKGYVAPGKQPSPKMMSAYYAAQDAGLREDSPAFTAHMDKVLGHVQQQAAPAGAAERFQELPKPVPQQQAKRGGPVPAAPPSRAASPSNNAGGRQYALTRDQHQTAQRLGMSNAEYIAGLQEGIKRGKIPAHVLQTR